MANALYVFKMQLLSKHLELSAQATIYKYFYYYGEDIGQVLSVCIEVVPSFYPSQQRAEWRAVYGGVRAKVWRMKINLKLKDDLQKKENEKNQRNKLQKHWGSINEFLSIDTSSTNI